MEFVINERRIKCEVKSLIGDNADYVANFTFDEEWEGKTKTARFQMKGKYVDVILENDQCAIPVEILKQGILSVGVYTDKITSMHCELTVMPSIKEKAGNVAAPTDDVYEQLISQIDNMEAGSTSDKLAGKKILCLGDSLMAGNGWAGGYANCIKENHPACEITNLAVSGATLIANDTNNYIYKQLEAYYGAGYEAPDLIIFDGGGNDGLYQAEIGTGALNSSYIKGVQTTTCDALEYLIYAINTKYPTTKLLYLSHPPMMQWSADNSVVPGVPTPDVQISNLETIEKVLHKWGIPEADLFRNGNVTSANAEQIKLYFMDGTDTLHLNEAGYRRVAPVIEDALNKLI